MKKFALLGLLLLFFVPLAVFADPPSGGIGIGGGVGNSNVQTNTSVNTSVNNPPSVFSEGSAAPDLSAPPPVDGTAITSVQANVNYQESAGATAADLAGQLNCPNVSGGGALQQAISSLGGRLGQAALRGVANGLSSYGVFGQAAGSILTGEGVGDAARGLVGTAGNYAGNAVAQNIAGSCGDSSLGRQICGTVGSAVGNYVQGAVNQYGGQILNNIGLGSAGQLFSGSGALGSVGGIISGGGQVPVACDGCVQAQNQGNQISSQIQNIVNHTDVQTGTLVNLNCNVNPSVAVLGNNVRQQVTSQVLGYAQEQQVEDRQGEILNARLSAISELSNDPNLNSGQRAAIGRWANEITNGQAIDCASAPSYSGSFGSQLLEQIDYSSNCSDTALLNRFNTIQQQAVDNYTALTNTTNGPRPRGVCVSGPNAGQTNHPELCPLPGEYQVSYASADVASAGQRAAQVAFDFSPTSLGTAANNLVADLLNEVFTAVADQTQSGLTRLISKKANGSRGGSYIDLLSGNVNPSLRQGTDYLTSSITDALSIEAEYQNATQNILSALTSTQTVFINIQACYATLAAHPAGNITAAAAQTATDNASTTANVVLGRQVQARKQNIDASQSAVNDLGVLLDKVQAARTPDEVNAASDIFNAMGVAGRLHTPEELQLLADDVNQLVPALALAKQDADSQLTTCQAYGTATTTTGG